MIQILLKQGYTKEELLKEDIAKEIINDNSKIYKYITDKAEIEKFTETRKEKVFKTLLECGFKEEEIIKQNLVEKYINPRVLQKYIKNNPNAGKYGYSILNGIYTEPKNCKIVNLPQNVEKIRLSSDGFPIKALNNGKDLGYAIRKNRRLTFNDPLGIAENEAVGSAMKQSKRNNILANDDASAIDIIIKYVEERDDEDRER